MLVLFNLLFTVGLFYDQIIFEVELFNPTQQESLYILCYVGEFLTRTVRVWAIGNDVKNMNLLKHQMVLLVKELYWIFIELRVKLP